MKTEHEFQAAYERLSEDGHCDSYGGMESERVYREWVECGKPADLDAFICDRANVGPL
jgi:hypothetical protein